MNLHLAGRTVMITGAASGIGQACAWAFAHEGSRLALLDIDAAAGQNLAAELRAELGAEVAFVAADVASEPEVTAAVNSVAARFGSLDVLIGCAGISGPFGAGLSDISVSAWDAVMAVNVRGPFLLVKHAYPHLAAAEFPAIVFLASDSSFVAAPGMVPYNASKGAVLQLTRALSVELADDRIRVNCVCPSVVDTPMSRQDLGLSATGFSEVGFPVQTPHQVASTVLYLASPVSMPVNGTSVVSDFGYLARSAFPA